MLFTTFFLLHVYQEIPSVTTNMWILVMYEGTTHGITEFWEHLLGTTQLVK